ncbi:RCC1 and BTB domain-containing protein 1-like [Cloeon dipterum]|uniref:RCC1 and BTB domain-containing protein 1-like n=1 Tax=Cloeon dipterum TaxID=197152 RepID=UPI0032209E6C
MSSNCLNKWKLFVLLSKEVKQNIRLAIVFGRNAIFVMRDDDVYGFGINANGCLGIGDTQPHTKPEKIQILCGQNVIGLEHGGFKTKFSVFAICSSGTLFAWGKNERGELGLGTKEYTMVPTKVEGDLEGKRVVQVACGKSHTLVLTSDGEVFAFGSNDYGQLGLGNTVDTSHPKKVNGLLAGRFVTAVACGFVMSFALLDTGEVITWGKAQIGEVDSTQALFPNPRIAPGSEGVLFSKIVCGPTHALLLSREGEVRTWGYNTTDQLVEQRLGPAIHVFKDMGRVTDIAASQNPEIHHSSAAINENGQVFRFNVWGALTSLTSETPELTSFSTLDEVFAATEPEATARPLRPKFDSINSTAERFFEDPETCNFTFIVEGKKIHVHKLILVMRSTVFRAIFYGKYFKDSSVRELTIEGSSYEAFHAFLKYFYTNEINLNDDIITSLIGLSCFFLVADIQEACIKYTKQNLNMENVAVFHEVARFHKFEELEDTIFDFFLDHEAEVKSAFFSKTLKENDERVFSDRSFRREILKKVIASQTPTSSGKRCPLRRFIQNHLTF